MKINKALIILLLILIACTTAVSAQLDPAPTVSLSAQPATGATTSVTLRATARDSGNAAGLSHVEIYLNNTRIATKQCGYATRCILSHIRLASAPKTETFHAIAYDRSQNTQSNNLTVQFKGANLPPNMSALPNISINEDSGYNANLTDLWVYVTDSWTAPENLTYSITGQTNTTVASCVLTNGITSSNVSNSKWINCNTTTQDLFGTSIITLQASDGQLTQTENITVTVLPVNDAPVSSAIPNITFAEDTNYTFNLSDYFIDVDDPKSSFTFSNSPVNNITVTYTKTGNLTQALLVSDPDFNGAAYINFTAYDGKNYSNASNNVMINVTPVNDAPFWTANTPRNYVYVNVPYSYQFNATDIDIGDTLTFYDNTNLFNIDPNSGWVNFTANTTGNHSVLITVCDDSGAANNCTNVTWNFGIYTHPPIIFNNRAVSPISPVAYSPSTSYLFTVQPAIQAVSGVPAPSETIDDVWLEFNGTNYTATNLTGGVYRVNLTSLTAGNYTYRWHANYTGHGLQYNSTWQNYTIDKAIPTTTITCTNCTGNTVQYGTSISVNCTTTSTATPVLTRNGNAVSNPDTASLGAGNYTYVCTVPANQNYTADNVTSTITVNPLIVNVSLTLQTPITYGTAANVTCNASPATITPTLTRNGAALPGLTDNSTLGAGNYTYVCYYNATQNNTGANATQTLVVNQVQTVINLTLNGTNGNMNVPINGTVLVNATTNIPGGVILGWYYNGNYMGNIPPAWTLGPLTNPGIHNITATYAGSQNYKAATATRFAIVAAPFSKFGFNPASGSNINGTSFALSFSTNYNTSCRWSLTDQAYTAMTNDFITTGQTTHSGTITGINNLGNQNVHVACINETAITNSDLTYNVQNVFSQGTTLTNGASVNNSILAGTGVSNSTLQSVNATNSVINGSILTKCVVINSTVKNYAGSNCVIVNSFVDPPNPGSNLTGSNITGNSRVMNSNVTYSTVDDSAIEQNSNVDHSTIIDNSLILRSTLSYCTIDSSSVYDSSCTQTIVNDSVVRDNSNVQNSNITFGSVVRNSTVINSILDHSEVYNATVTAANITNGVIYSGVITQGAITYNASTSGSANVSDVINLVPDPAFIYSPSSPKVNQQITFNAANSTDPNIGGPLNDSIVNYYWDFGGGTNKTGVTATNTYATTGSKTIMLRLTDSYGAQAYILKTINVVSASGGNTNTNTGGGSPGGGGGGSAFYARTWKIDLDIRSMDIRTFNRVDKAVLTVNNKTYTLRMDGIDRNNVNFTLGQVPYSLVNYEIKKIDLDLDGYSDIRVIILTNYFTRAQIRFDRFKEKMDAGAVSTILSSSLLANWGMNETIPVLEQTNLTIEDKEPAPVEKKTEPKDTEKEETKQSITSALFAKIPKDNQTVGIGITAGIVIAGLIVYFLCSLILV